MADDGKRLITADLLRVLGYSGDMPRGAVLERVHVDALKFSRSLVGLLLFAVELGDVASVEALADQAQQRLDGVNAEIGRCMHELTAAQAAAEAAREEAAAIGERAHTAAAAAIARADAEATEKRAAAETELRRATTQASQIIAEGQMAAAAHVDQVKAAHAALEAEIETKSAVHAELEAKIADRREILASVRSQAKRAAAED